jgi:hypothetical protein
MTHDLLTFEQRNVRGADSNSLLRMYDQAKEIFSRARLQQERSRADKAIQRIAKELNRRKISF